MEGIIYKVQPYQESSKLLFVYTTKGKYTLISKGALKVNTQLRSISQYLTLISFDEDNKKMFALKNAKIVDDFQNIKEDYNIYKNAAVILEVLDKLIYEDNEHEKIYIEALKALKGDLSYSFLSFLIRILFYLGFAPNIKGNGKKVKGMNAEQGGIVYEEDNSCLDLNYGETVVFLRVCSSSIKKEELEDSIKNKLIHFIAKYYQYHLQISLKTLQ